MLLKEILSIPESPVRRELLHAVDVIDSMHRWPAIPQVPLVFSRSKKEEGAYHSLTRPAQPIRIEISQFASHAALTLVHEAGHMIDQVSLNSFKTGFGSECDPAFETLWRLWQKSHMVRNLQKLYARSRANVPPASRRLLRYHLQLSELGARTYAQWVALRSNDLLLCSQLNSARSQEGIFASGPARFNGKMMISLI